TSRRAVLVRRPPDEDPATLGRFRQVQRMGNPLINELIIGTGFKDRFSMDDPWNDAQFANFFLHPVLAAVFASLGIPGPIADVLRINTGIPPTPLAAQKRLALLTLLDGDPANDDAAGFPNGRRPGDDVTDIAARAVGGILADPVAFGTRIGDGVNADDKPKRGTFPYVNPSQDGR